MGHRPLWTAKRILSTTLVNFSVVVGSLHVDRLHKTSDYVILASGGLRPG